MLEIPPAFNAMAAYRQFILWISVPSKTRPGKVDKFPINPQTRKVSDAHSSEIWLTGAEAVALATQYQCGVGFVFTTADPFFFLDIDDCLQDDGQWSPLALSLCNAFPGCAVEVSQSGKGLHIFGTGVAPDHGCKNMPLGLEFYTEGRFAALTGTGAVGDSATPGPIDWLVANYFPPSPHVESADWTDGPCDEWNGLTDDTALIEKMLKSKSASSAFSGRASLSDLWAADDEALGNNYPDSGMRSFDHSSADAALCQHLAFWTGKDCERMDRLFRESGLMRDKWDAREDYRQATILRAVGLCGSVYGKSAKPEPVAESMGSEAKPREGFQYLAPTQQAELFKGCVYVRDMHRVFTPDGGLLRPEQFKATYGGYVFALDAINDKVTKNAWEVFTESQAITFPRAHATCFRPEVPSGAIVPEEGATMVNTYVPIDTPREQGDPSRFLEHVARLLPNANDQAILLAYMASVIQNPGYKMQWAPLIQGMEGNGKSLISSVVSRAVGLRYTHKLNPQDIGNVFNAWVSNKLFVAVEEVYTADKREVMDTLKWLITDKRVPITPKGVDQITGDNRANFILTTNHKDAIRKTKTDRRYCIFYTAQQNQGDLEASGMGGSYFPDLYDWLRAGGYAIVTEYLHTYEVPAELDPSGACHRAPATTSTEEALDQSLGGIEQEIMEAIEEGRQGFSGGWISSMAFNKMLEDRRDTKRIPPKKRKGIMDELGFDLHPGLKEGRVNNIIPMDNGKPRLYIKRGHISANLTTCAEIVKAYTDAQGGVGVAPGGTVADVIIGGAPA